MGQRLMNLFRNSPLTCWGFVLAALLSTILQGAALQTVILLATAILVSIPLFLGVIYQTINALIRKASLERARSLIRHWALFAACLVFSYVFGWAINDWKIEEAHSYVRRAIPVLEQVKASKGAYPSQIPIEKIGPLPTLLHSPGQLFGFSQPGCYQSDGHTYAFHFVDPASIFGDGEMYNSSAGFWTSATSD